MLTNKHIYSNLITAISYGLDLSVINIFVYFFSVNIQNEVFFHSYISFAWIITSLKNEFYKIHINTKVTYILNVLYVQFALFFIILYAFIGFFKQPNISRLNLAQYFAFVFIIVFIIKFMNYILLIKYRKYVKGNIRDVVVIGKNKKTEQLINFFAKRTDFGYQFIRQFCTKEKKFDIADCFGFIIHNNIDEIYCSVSELNNNELDQFINFADNNLKILKFIPDNKNIFSKKLKFEYYDYTPVLSLRDIPLHNTINAVLKRAFDIVFSVFIIVGLLSWLTPILAIIIFLESKSRVFFIQKRNGMGNREFYCYKFRSMKPNGNADSNMAIKNDIRITKVGKFIRKNSIDELPQFYNVLLGSMSVVGPRPHMVKHTNEYADKVNKYMLRHFVKPGITGLAQIKGYRGEIEKKSDILNRTRFDIFYIENWSLFLDLKIIVQTVLNAVFGEEKAY